MPLKHTVEEIILKNGAKGLLIHVPGTTSVHYDVQFHAGNNFVDRQEASQVAHIMEHMSFGANQVYPTAEAFSQEFTKNGAYSNAWTGSSSMVYNVDAALMEWKRILELQELSITKPKFLPSSLKAEKGNVKEELIGYANNHGRILWQTIMRQSGIQRWFDADELKTIENVTIQDIKHHYKKTHTTRNMRFVIAGDLKKHRKTITRHFEGWGLPEGEHLAIEPERLHSTGLVHIMRKDLPNLTFNLFLYLNRELKRREKTALTTLNHILTGTFHSRIWGKARQRGICYGMGSWFDTDASGISDWGFGGQVSRENAHELFTLISKELNLIASEGVSEEELAQAKEYRLGALQMGTETVGSLAGWYGDAYFEDGTIDRVGAMPGLIKGTTIEEIQGLVNEFLHSGAWAFGGIGNVTKKELQVHYDLFESKLIK